MCIARRRTAAVLGLLWLVTCHLTHAQQPFADVEGTWRGLYNCSGYFWDFTLKVSRSNTVLSADYNATVYGPAGNKHSTEQLVFTGEYLREVGYFELADRRNRRGLRLKGVMEADGPRFTGVVSGGSEKQCSYVIAGRSFDRTLSAIRDQSRAPRKQAYTKAVACSAQMEAWLREPITYGVHDYAGPDALAAGRLAAAELFQDERFTPHFGKRFSAMRKRDLGRLEAELARGCWSVASEVGGFTRVGQALLAVLRANGTSGARANVFIHPHAKAVASSWREAALGAVDIDDQRNIDRLVYIARSVLPVLAPTGKADMSAALVEVRSSVDLDVMMADLRQRLSGAPYSLGQLVELVAFDRRIKAPAAQDSFNAPRRDWRAQPTSPQRTRTRTRSRTRSPQPTSPGRAPSTPGERDYAVADAAAAPARAMIRQTINAHVIDSLAAYGAGPATPEHVSALLHPSAPPHGSLEPYLEADVKQRFVRTLYEAGERLTATLVQQERTRYRQEVLALKSSPASLAAAVTYERGFAQRQGALVGMEAYAVFNGERARHRRALLEEHRAFVTQGLATAQSPSALEQRYRRYVARGDLTSAEGLPLKRVYDERMGTLRPFRGYPGGDYLNAVYAGDVGQVGALDQRYAGNVQAIGREVMGDNPVGQLVVSAAGLIKLLPHMLNTYLLAYDREFGRCLRPGAYRFTVRHTEQDGYQEVTQDTEYRVNEEFATIFEEVWNIDAGQALMGDLLFNRGAGTQLRTGVLRMMSEHPCDGEVIARMERNMIALYRQR